MSACFAHVKLINFVLVLERVERLLKPISFLLAIIVRENMTISDATVGEYWEMVPENVFTHVCENH